MTIDRVTQFSAEGCLKNSIKLKKLCDWCTVVDLQLQYYLKIVNFNQLKCQMIKVARNIE